LGNAVLLPKVGSEKRKTQRKRVKFRRISTKKHEKEEKMYDFTQFREARLPKLGKIIQQVVVPIVLRNLLPWLPKIWIEQMRTMMPIVTLSLHCCSW
jgi:hypothetical protein